MDVAIHWRDADSSSAKAIFPEAEIMLCGGHAGRAQKNSGKTSERKFYHVDKYKDNYPVSEL